MEDFGSDFITIVDEDGQEYELEVLSTLEYDGNTYLAVIPAGEHAEEFQLEVSILKSVEEEDGESILSAIEDEEELQAVAFAAEKDEENQALQWLATQSGKLSEKEHRSLQQVVDYLEEMDEKTCSCLEKDAVRLTLFASCQRGCGSVILQQLEERLRRAGFKTMYLWTDSDCNHQWYPNHGFTLVAAQRNETFSTPEKNFMTYIFKKQL